VAAAGVRFSSVDGDAEFKVDPVPRVIAAREWHHLEAGLAQRFRALNAFVADVYGPQMIVHTRVVPRRVVDGAEHLEPRLQGYEPPAGQWIGIAGLDVVRDADGRFLVLEDNLRTPSGFGYAVAARRAVAAQLGVAPEAGPCSLDGAVDLLAGALRGATPAAALERGDPHWVVLTDGRENSAYWEHRWAARELGIPLVEPRELEVRAGRLWWRHPDETRTPRWVDALYRRTNDDRLDTPVGELLAEPMLKGTLGLVSAFGLGVADDKLAHAYVEEMIRFYLHEQPLLGSVPTYDLGRPDHLEHVLDRIDELVVKPRGMYGGVGVVVAPHAERADVEKTRAAVRERPEDFVAQEMIPLSTHPTVVGDELEPRHVDLRPFIFMGEGGLPHVLPGGLTRVALDEGSLVVNSSQNGGAKDTWVLP
jgi:uncharacterized circularly permuted ATP-grasp superfamily protein